jgi:transketolase
MLTQTMEAKIKQIDTDVLKSSFEAGACHLGSSLSCTPIMVKLFYETLTDRDIFIFSKASGAATYYAILADKGYFPKEKLAEYLKNYPEVSKEVPGVIWSGGSVGHGLAVAVGLAHADRTRNVYVLISDGECQEGVTYESALFARQHKLTNLFVICDDNGIQALDRTEDVLDLETAFEFYQNTFPNFKREKTKKGRGISFLEDKVESHYMNLTKELLDKAILEINEK